MRPEDRLVAVRDAEARGKRAKMVLFWGQKPDSDGSTGRGCFSQWWPAAFAVDGVAYPSAEHWMMAGKARLFDDADGLAAVMTARSPGAAKAAGRTVRGFDEQQWAAARYGIVLAGSLAKFTQHPDLAEVLLRTGNQILVEASPLDRIWGIGLSADHPDATRPSRWRGLNLLGFALMDTRERLREQSAAG
ncbi:MAG: hypothetical protein QG622_2906 [Actinomycetota bacterium]|nr:hypothetical protein [Actinomycetota bacterium]